MARSSRASAKQAVAQSLARFIGATIHARGNALGVIYPPVPGASFQGPGLHPHTFYRDAWTHEDYRHHVIWQLGSGHSIVTQLANGSPHVSWAESLGKRLFGAGAKPVNRTMYPLALRMPLRPSPGPFALTLPSRQFLCQRLWPSVGHTYMTRVEGIDVELRITGSRVPRLNLYAEAFLGRAHENGDGEPRCFQFSEDARHLQTAPQPGDIRRVTVKLLHELVTFVDFARCLGLDVDVRKRLPGGIVGRVLRIDDAGNPEFAVKVLQPMSAITFKGSVVTAS
jgi:hypothetical protein